MQISLFIKEKKKRKWKKTTKQQTNQPWSLLYKWNCLWLECVFKVLLEASVNISSSCRYNCEYQQIFVLVEEISRMSDCLFLPRKSRSQPLSSNYNLLHLLKLLMDEQGPWKQKGRFQFLDMWYIWGCSEAYYLLLHLLKIFLFL